MRPFFRLILLALMSSWVFPVQAQPAASTALSNPADEKLLGELIGHAWQFFQDERNPDNQLLPDQARTDGSGHGEVASIATVGFGMAAICVAETHGWISPEKGRQRVIDTLRYCTDQLENHHGFFFHFYDMKTGQRAWKCELSPIDTTLLIMGAITAREYFHDPEITRLTNQLYARIDWPWMLNGEKTLAMGWKPETGFMPCHWNNYCELMDMYLLGLASPTHPLPPETWRAWKRGPVDEQYGYRYIQCPPLFAHQYSHAFIDFRNKTDGYADYFENSRLATLAQREMCIQTSGRFPAWGPNVWGISASESPLGYRAWGGPPADANLDGTIVPCAAAGSIPFAPQECLRAVGEMKAKYGKTIWGKYGFADAFNPLTGWVAPDVLGIDVGITIVQAENYRSGLIWNMCMQAPEIQRALQIAGFYSGARLLPNSSLVDNSIHSVQP